MSADVAAVGGSQLRRDHTETSLTRRTTMSILPRGVRRASSALVGLAFVAACHEDPVVPTAARMPAPTSRPSSAVAPPASSVPTPVTVPAIMRTSPFNTAMSLLVPPNFTISVYARIPGARFMAVTPDGNLLVSKPGADSVLLVRPNGSADPLITNYV